MVLYDYRQRYGSANEVLQAIKTLSPKPRSRKLWLGVGAVAIITPLILWILYQFINPKPTLSTSEERGITIKYPSDGWQPIKPPSNDIDSEVIKFIPKNQNQVDFCTLEIIVNINELPQQLLSLEEYKNSAIQKIKKNNPNQQVKDDSQPSTTLSNFNAYKLTYTRQDGQCKLKVMEIGTVRNGKAYFISYTAEEKEYNKYLELVEIMINSFEIKVE